MEVTDNKRVRWARTARRALAVVAVLLLAFLTLVPTGRYLARAGWEEGKILARRESIAQLVADAGTFPPVRAKLALVLAAREFAHDSLGLETGSSFTTYSRMDRDTLVLVLSGAYRDKLKSYTWWFPVVGRVPYKGYFDFDEAKRQERSLTGRGFDARLGAASAFSTLGWFNDPLLPTTLRADSLTLVNTVIHELTHNTYYAPGGAVFNESFANFVGTRGAERFFLARGQPRAAAEIVARWGDERLLARYWAGVYAKVDTAFRARPGDDSAHVASRIAARDSIFALEKERLVLEVGPQLRTISPKAVARVKLDNAVLMSRRVYLTELDAFEVVYARHGSDLRATVKAIVAAVKEGRKNGEKPFDVVRRMAGLPAAANDSTP